MAHPASIFRPKVGRGQSLALTESEATSFADKIGTGTYFIALSTTTANCLVCVSAAGTAATASSDILLKTTEPSLVLACAPGDTVSAYGLGSGGTAYLAELSG